MSAVHSVATAVLRFFVRREQKNVALTLMVSFRMEVIHKFLQRPSQRCFAEQDQIAQALLFSPTAPSLLQMHASSDFVPVTESAGCRPLLALPGRAHGTWRPDHANA